jgi:hypothetical protein
MTIREHIHQRLVNCGLWQDEATLVIAQLELATTPEMPEWRWNDHTEGYSPQLLAALWAAASVQALEWIDRNAPKHFARPMFQSGGERKP